MLLQVIQPLAIVHNLRMTKVLSTSSCTLFNPKTWGGPKQQLGNLICMYPDGGLRDKIRGILRFSSDWGPVWNASGDNRSFVSWECDVS